MKLNCILITGFLIVALLVGVIGFTSVNQSQKVLEESIGKNSVIFAQAMLDKIDSDIYNRIEEFQAYSKDLVLQETVIKSNQEFDNMEDPQGYINEKDKAWSSASKETLTPFMQQLIANELSEELREKTEFYEEKYDYNIYGEVFVTNKYGANVAQTGKTSDYYQADEEWWQTAKNQGLYIRDVEYDESADVFSTDIGIRIDDKNGNFMGVMKVVLNIEQTINDINNVEYTSMYETMNLELLTKDGKLIYKTAGYKILEEHQSWALLEFENIDRDYLIVKESGEEEELLVRAYSKGYRDYKGLGWILMIEYKTEEIFVPIAKIRNIILAISFIAIILAISIGLLTSYLISKPLSKLTNAVDEVSKGNFKIEIETQGKIDEVNKLADSLNRIMKTMKLAVLEKREKKK